MKNVISVLTFISVLIASVNLYAQGSGIVNFANLASDNTRRIWFNNSGIVGDGVLVSGTGFRVALYWGQQGTPEPGLVQVGNPASFLTGTAAGTFTSGNRTLTPLPVNGAVATLQARAWIVVPGVPDTYEAVLAAALSGDSRAAVGKNSPFDHQTQDPTNPTLIPKPIGGPVANEGNPDWRGFAISTIPEPSTVTLAVVSCAALMLFCRRKKTL